jgi:hypothetical protein
VNNLSWRIERIEEKLGMRFPRYILVVSRAGGGGRNGPGVEFLPGRYALAWGGPLTADELEELKIKYAKEPE